MTTMVGFMSSGNSSLTTIALLVKLVLLPRRQLEPTNFTYKTKRLNY